MAWTNMGTTRIDYSDNTVLNDVSQWDNRMVFVPIPRSVLESLANECGTNAAGFEMFGHRGNVALFCNGTFWGTTSQLLLVAGE